MHRSIATIDSPEFINLQPLDINPLMSKCEIKVFYLGESRNGTFIDKEVATQMAKTLRGAPIVGYFKKSEEDFADHGEQVIIDDEGIKFNCLTTPYGFVSPDAQVWFKKFDDYDDFGNSVEREYLMTTGFLWTGQFPECDIPLQDGGRPHSMELDGKTMQGHWAENYKNGMDFFIINDAVFSKLCILGESTEPCFEGSSITTPEISKNFSLDNNFKNTLFTMMQDLQIALKGENNMKNTEKNFQEKDKNNEVFGLENEEHTEKVVESEFVASKKEEEKEPQEEKKDSSENDKEEEKKKFAKKEDEEENSSNKDVSKEESSDKAEEENASDKKEEDDEKKKQPPTKSELEIANETIVSLNEKLDNLSTQFSSLEKEVQDLRAFKLNVSNKEKDELINSFYMLSDDDKAEFIKNKEKYSLAEIEKELKVICFDKQITFNKETNQEPSNVTFSLNNTVDNSHLPEWVRDVKEIQSK